MRIKAGTLVEITNKETNVTLTGHLWFRFIESDLYVENTVYIQLVGSSDHLNFNGKEWWIKEVGKS